MGQLQDNRVAFNRGLISKLGLARVDLKRSALSAQTMVNWQPRALGSMMLRAGTGYLSSTEDSNYAINVPFVFRADDTALIEFTNGVMQVRVNDAVVSRTAVTTTVTNGDFTVDVAGWTDSDEAGGVSDWVTDGAGGGYMRLLGNGTAAAIRDQNVMVSGSDTNTIHGLRVVIARGPVTLLLGTTLGGGQYVGETTLLTGTHSIAFTPTAGNVFIRLMSTLDRYVLVDSCNIDAAGDLEIPSPYLTADLDNIRGDDQISQSGNIIFIACQGYQQREIIRYSATGWGLALYQPEDGPFRIQNVTTITIAPAAISGNTTLTASRGIFKSTHVGALFQIASSGQVVNKTATAPNVFSDPIRVVGVGTTRAFTLVIAGLTATGSTVTLQRSPDAPGTWTDVTNYVADTTVAANDTLDNQIDYYRIGVKAGNYVAGTIVMSLTIGTGSITGVARVTAFTSSTVVDAEILVHMGGTTASDTWSEGEWSDLRGWPTSVGFCEARLCWAGADKVQCSTTDGFTVWQTLQSDGSLVGDSGPIDRSIGSGPVDIINWILPLQRLILGGQMAEFSCRSSAFDDPLTPSNFNIKPCSNQGSANVRGVRIDTRGAFVQRGGTRLFELAFDGGLYDYVAKDLTLFFPEAGGEADSETYIKRIAVQRQPDTRIHCIRSDGVAAVLVYDSTENVLCWILHDTDGEFEDVAVLPSQTGKREDQVYYVVKRTIMGATVRYLEKWAYESECQGGTFNKQADSFVAVTLSPANTVVTGFGHLNGEEVVVWADGVDIGTDDSTSPPTQLYSVSGGQIYLTGTKYLYVPGALGGLASTPDSAALDILGDLTIEVSVALDSWRPAIAYPILSKNNTFDSAYYVFLNTSGTLAIVTSGNGTVAITSTSTAAVPVGTTGRFYMRWSVDVDNGAAGNTVTIETSTDGVTYATLGAPIINAGTTSIFNSTQALRLGSIPGPVAFAFSNLLGKFYSAKVYSGIGLAKVLKAEFEAEDTEIGATTAVSSTTGETYTLTAPAVFTADAIPSPVTNVVAGLPYDASFMSAKLGTALTNYKNIDHLGLVMGNVHPKGLRFGPSLDPTEMDYISQNQNSETIDPDTILTEFDETAMIFPGTWDTDARLCLLASAPRPVTVLAAIVEGEQHPS